jgi:hypothetical protein
MNIRSDAEAINLRNQRLRSYNAKELSVSVVNDQKFHYRVVGSKTFASTVTSQLNLILKKSKHGRLLLQELAKLPKIIDFVEYKTSHAAFHSGSIVVLHNATAPQGDGLARFESKTGKMFRGSFLPEMVLAHELFHAGQFQKASFFEPYCNFICSFTGGPWKLPKSAFEIGAIKYTNQIRIDNNIGYVRAYYNAFGGTKIDSYEETNDRRKGE